MKRVAITQRVTYVPDYGERRDCLDQAWPRFLSACGLMPLIVPNIPHLALALCRDEAVISGLLLTGGNDLMDLGGDAPERDATENGLLDMAESQRLPVLGVCRGMQILQQRRGIHLQAVAGHVAPRQVISIAGSPAEVNSYHLYGTFESRPPLEIWAVAGDGVVKAVRDKSAASVGIMWHPERMDPFAAADIALFRDLFKVH